MNIKDIENKWNEQADEFNQWIDLDADERVNFVLSINNSNNQQEILKWAVDTFGTIAIDKEERVKRFAEEAIELCQVCGLSTHDLSKIIRHVYSKEPGYVIIEIGQVGMCLSMLAEVNEINVTDEINYEFDRVRTFDKEYWQTRQNKKADQGVAGFCDD